MLVLLLLLLLLLRVYIVKVIKKILGIFLSVVVVRSLGEFVRRIPCCPRNAGPPWPDGRYISEFVRSLWWLMFIMSITLAEAAMDDSAGDQGWVGAATGGAERQA